jgi:hypothetical protein
VDAPTHFFHVHANSRCQCKFINSLQQDSQVFLDEHQKAEIAFSYFDGILGTPPTTSAVINQNVLGIPKIDATHLEQRFIETEVWDVIKSLPQDKRPGQMVSLPGFCK